MQYMFYSFPLLMLSKTKKAFTLIEMLIVIVIIGILAAALIPRLLSVQGRARDAKRKADLEQIGAGLAVYKADNTTFPSSGGNVLGIQALLTGYMSAVPTDTISSYIWEIASTATGTSYGYTSVKRNGVANAGALLAAVTENDGSSSNYYATGAITSATDGAAIDAGIAGCGGQISWSNVGTCANINKGDQRYYYDE